jgi:hypothetical protein
MSDTPMKNWKNNTEFLYDDLWILSINFAFTIEAIFV